MRMLIADDHQQITQVLAAYAKKEGFETIIANDGAQALALATEEDPDIILLDVMMPRMDGFEVCRRIRAVSAVPIIMITARGEDFERIMGLDIGADDYIVKPFSPTEVMARVRAVLRRADVKQDSQPEGMKRGKLILRMDTADVSVDGQKIPLTKKEMDLLYTLADKPGRVFTREQLLDSLWGYDYFGDSRTVDSHIKRLRAKLDVTDKPGFSIRTVWGRGYQFEVTDDEA
ncbi:MAG: response regulator transcription factor [Christensenellales bacterium]|jgi:DNA-binding response OmpR family regulator|nr:response regulator transcription factor [Clostridiales bacterium]